MNKSGDIFIKFDNNYVTQYVFRLTDGDYAQIAFIKSYTLIERKLTSEDYINTIKLEGLRAEQVWSEAVSTILYHYDFDPSLNFQEIKWDADIKANDDISTTIDKVNKFKEQFTTPLTGDCRNRTFYRNFIIDRNTKSIYRDGIDLRLDKNEFKLFLYLLENPNKIHSRNEIIDTLWGGNKDLKLVDVTVSKIRKKTKDKEFITTKPGEGYIVYT